MVPGLGDKSFEDRLRELKLPTLTYRRIQGDMVEVFKLVNDMYYFDCTNLFTFRDQSERVTRGNKKKLFKHRARLDVRKYSFSNRVVNLWNSLPDSVISAETVFCFETRLDNHWKDQDILYEYESKLILNYRVILKTRSWCYRYSLVVNLLPEVNLCIYVSMKDPTLHVYPWRL